MSTPLLLIMSFAALSVSTHAIPRAASPVYVSSFELWAESARECFSDPKAPSVDSVRHDCWTERLGQLLPLMEEKTEDLSTAEKFTSIAHPPSFNSTESQSIASFTSIEKQPLQGMLQAGYDRPPWYHDARRR